MSSGNKQGGSKVSGCESWLCHRLVVHLDKLSKPLLSLSFLIPKMRIIIPTLRIASGLNEIINEQIVPDT